MGFVTGQRLIGAALALATALALIPSSWMRPWSGDVALVLTLPLRPVERGLAALGDWLRAPDEPYPGVPREVAALAGQRDALQGELDRALLRIAAMEAQLAELRVAVDADTRGGWRPVLASVVERPSGRRAGLLGINVGSADGVREGDPVVVGGNRLLGQVVSPVERSRAWVATVDSGRTGRIDAVVLPGGTMLQLVAGTSGQLAGELERAAPVKVGDGVLLKDSTWKPAAQGMRLGSVESAGALDSNPLRAGVTVRMDLEPARVSSVTVKVADEGAPPLSKPGGARK